MICDENISKSSVHLNHRQSDLLTNFCVVILVGSSKTDVHLPKDTIRNMSWKAAQLVLQERLFSMRRFQSYFSLLAVYLRCMYIFQPTFILYQTGNKKHLFLIKSVSGPPALMKPFEYKMTEILALSLLILTLNMVVPRIAFFVSVRDTEKGIQAWPNETTTPHPNRKKQKIRRRGFRFRFFFLNVKAHRSI